MFRRDKQAVLKWRHWLGDNRDRLVALGIAPFVLDAERNWLFFLDHGYFTPLGGSEPIINIDRMDEATAAELCRFLEQDGYYPNSSTLNCLRHRLK